MSKRKILLVGDVVEDSTCGVNCTVFDVDNPSRSEVACLVSWLSEAGYSTEVCDDVRAFTTTSWPVGEIVVFPLWRGGASRNRTAIVPAHCEVLGVPYVGGDAYVQTVCQDKALSKLVARAVGITAPADIPLWSERDLIGFKPLSLLRCPVVVKPLFSACSIGVDESSLCFSDTAARQKARQLFAESLGPVICEEFVQGEEVSLCFVEERGTFVKRAVGVYRAHDDSSPFHNRLMTLADKLNPTPPWRIDALPDSEASDVWPMAEQLSRLLGKVDLMRIDGRLTSDGFVLIELTPDIHMAMESMFMGSFCRAGCSPPELLDSIIQATIKNGSSGGVNGSCSGIAWTE